jgi:hypothetical protein
MSKAGEHVIETKKKFKNKNHLAYFLQFYLLQSLMVFPGARSVKKIKNQIRALKRENHVKLNLSLC